MLSLAREAPGPAGISVIGLIVTAGHPVPARAAVKDMFARGYGTGLAATALAATGATVAMLTLPGPERPR